MSQALQRPLPHWTNPQVYSCGHGLFFAGTADITKMVEWQELIFLYILVERHLIHLGYILASFFIY